MISQISSSPGYTIGDTGQSVPAANIAPQTSPSPVVLPSQPDHTAVSAAAAKVASATINKFLQQNDSSIQFSVDASTDTKVVTVVDSATKEVIRQMPTKEMIEISKALDKLQGLLLKGKA